MSVGHSEASFNHSCLKVPVDTLSRKPLLKYERLSSADNFEKKETSKRQDSNYYNDFKTVKSYLEFYESIPDYTELHHLSNEEFYSRLKKIKITQKKFWNESASIDDIDYSIGGDLDVDNNFGKNYYEKNQILENRFCCSSCCINKDCCAALFCDKKVDEDDKQSQTKINIISDNENVSELCDSEIKKHSDYEADRESSTLQVGDRFTNNKKYLSSINFGDDNLSGSNSKRSRSLAISSGCDCDTPEICHRFPDFHFRDEEYQRKLDSGYSTSANEKSISKKSQRSAFRRTIPITSRIPLYDKIMSEKEQRRRILHEKYSEKLRSLVQPFSFTKREDENRKLRMARSNPELTSLNRWAPTVRFKAKPVPKNLFSNYAYERMKEDEFYRALRRKIRAEEMLKISSLPPSMARREKSYLSKSLEYLGNKNYVECDGYQRDSEERPNEMELDKKSKTNLSNKKNFNRLHKKSRRINSMTDSSVEVSPYESILSESRRKTRPHSAFGTGRENLASVLRIETARKRLEREMEEKLRANRLKTEARLKARMIRMSPEWRALNYDKEEDLALRIALRREENRMKEERHLKTMESMYGRVYRMPPLFNNERFQCGKNVKEKSIIKSENNYLSSNKLVENIKANGIREEMKSTKNNSLGLPEPRSVDFQEEKSFNKQHFKNNDIDSNNTSEAC